MKILALEHEVSGTEAIRFQQFAVAEARRVWDLCQAGVIRETYFRADRSESVLVLECPSREDAEAALATLPYVQQGLIAFELIPLRAYPGFERLFER